ncbi:MAG: energy transducer TonB family protein [Nitrospiraceae bacterium]
MSSPVSILARSARSHSGFPTGRSRDLVSGWGISVCAHALALTGALSLLADLPTIPPSAFRIEILLYKPNEAVASARASDPDSERPVSTPTPTPHEAAGATAGPIQSTSVIRRSVIERSVNQVTPPAQTELTSTLPATITHPSVIERSVSQITPLAQTELAPSLPATITHPSAVSVPQQIERQVDTVATVGPSHLTDTPVVSAERIERAMVTTSPPVMPTQVMQSVATTSQLTSEEHGSAPLPHDSTARDPADSASPSAGASSPTHPDGPEPFHQDDLASSAHNGEAGRPVAPAEHGSPTAPSPSMAVAMNHPPIVRTIPARPDFGWLTDLLKRKITTLQTYPRLARMQGWEGSVIVRATIGQDGALLATAVLRSSGHAVLDDDAVKLMRRACPIPLPRDLGQSQIDVLIPVHYRLEQE